MKITDIIGNLSDAHVESALDIDSAEAMKNAVNAEKKAKAAKMLKKIVPAAACICLIAAAVVIFTNKNQGGNGVMQIPNPNRIVASVDELTENLGRPFPILDGKTAELCVVTAVDGKVYKTEARYTDGTALAVGAGTFDISGIYGGKLDQTESLDGVTVDYYSYNGIFYAVWSQDGYSFCYYSSAAENETVKDTVHSIITSNNAHEA